MKALSGTRIKFQQPELDSRAKENLLEHHCEYKHLSKVVGLEIAAEVYQYLLTCYNCR